MAYELDFPSDYNIHHVFHVSHLNKVINTDFHTYTSLPQLDEEISIWLHP
jgi:hypothetical protein